MGNDISYAAHYDTLWYQEICWTINSKVKQQGRRDKKFEFYAVMAVSRHIYVEETLWLRRRKLLVKFKQ
jgi:hypothetical protein